MEANVSSASAFQGVTFHFTDMFYHSDSSASLLSRQKQAALLLCLQNLLSATGQGSDTGLLKAPLLLPLLQFTHLSPNTAIASKIAFLSILAVLTE